VRQETFPCARLKRRHRVRFCATAMADLALNTVFEQREVPIAYFTPRFAAKINPAMPSWRPVAAADPGKFQAPNRPASNTSCWTWMPVRRVDHASARQDVRSYYEQTLRA